MDAILQAVEVNTALTFGRSTNKVTTPPAVYQYGQLMFSIAIEFVRGRCCYSIDLKIK